MNGQKTKVVFMTDTLNNFDIYDRVVDLPFEQQQSALEELCAGDAIKIAYIQELLSFENDDTAFDDVFSQSVSSSKQGFFEPTSLIGFEANKFLLTDFLASGGFGYVFKAEDFRGDALNKIAAIKVIKPHLTGLYNYDIISREANIMAELSHKYIVRAWDSGSIECGGYSLPFYRMDYISGQNICDYFTPGEPIVTKLACILKVCEALAFAHSRTNPVVHADIKPENILISEQGDPKILDFGIAQHVHKQTSGELAAANNYAKVFSSDYSSPELLKGESLTRVADVYSLGVLIYQLLTGISPPFDTEKHLLSDHIPFHAYNTKYVPWLKELDSIILKATNKLPEKRYASVELMAKDIKAFMSLGVIDAHEKGRVYRTNKFLWTKPLHALALSLGVFSLIFTVPYNYYLHVEHQQNNIDQTLLTALNDNYKSHILNGTLKGNSDTVFIFNNLDLLQGNGQLSNKIKFSESMQLGKIALKKNEYAAAKRLFELAVESAAHYDNKISAKAYLAKSLFLLNEEEKAYLIAKPIFDHIKKQGINSIAIARAFINMFDVNVRFISDLYDDDVNDRRLLQDILNKFSFQLSNEELALVYYYDAYEYFYNFSTGDNLSPSVGVSDDYFLKHIAPDLVSANDRVEQAINAITGTEQTQLLPVFFSLKSRIYLELGHVELANHYSLQAVNMAVNNHGNTFVTVNALRYRYAVTRFTDLPAAVDTMEDALDVELSSYFSVEEDLLNLMLLNKAYLHAGLFDKSKALIEKVMANHYPNADNLNFKGLDSMTVILINYLEYVGFDLNDSLAKRVANALPLLSITTQKKYPDYVSDYEIKLAELYRDFYNENFDTVNALASEVMALRRTSEINEADIAPRLWLNIALMLDQTNNGEYAVILAKMADDALVYNSLELAYSVPAMNSFIQISQIYLKHNKVDDYLLVHEKAKRIFNSHYKVLKNTRYMQSFLTEPQII